MLLPPVFYPEQESIRDTIIGMTIGFYTSKHYFDLKKAALEEAVKKLGIEASIVLDNPFRPSLALQTFGFEDMFKRARACAAEALNRENTDIGIGIENSLSFIYNADEWYYVIGISLQTKDGKHAESFTAGIKVPLWMMKQVQDDKIKIDSLTQNLAGEDDPVMYFSGGTLTRKDLMVPALLLAFANLDLEKRPAVS
jgi:non-canonical (house-cleaning) NTP pyrophosphatase